MWTTSIIAAVAVLAIGSRGQPTETVDDGRLEVRDATPTASGAAEPTHTIVVGAEGFKFTPNSVNATVGSVVEFRFYPGGHRVARSGFEYPCIPYELTGPNLIGFASGDISPQVVSNNLPTFQVRVNDTEPIFFYCYAPGSCYQQHMIGVINPNSTETLDLQMQYVLNATYQVEPGQNFPSETVVPSNTPTSTGSAAAGADDSNDADDGDHHLTAGAIAGIAVGGAAVLILAGAIVFLCGRRGGLNMAYRRSTVSMASPLPPMAEARYAPDAKSPGQQTFSSHQYMAPGGGDHPYFADSTHPYGSTPPPPSMSPNQHQTYGTYLSSPLMAGSTDGTQGYYPAVSPPPVEMQQQPRHEQEQHMPIAPVELPASSDPGHSPLPGYQPSPRLSWAQGQETQYRPGSKA